MEFVNSLPEIEPRSLGATLGDVDPEGMPVEIFIDIKCFLIYLPPMTTDFASRASFGANA
jgi:hypothetical protein